MDGALINTLTTLSSDISPILTAWTIYLLLQVTKTLHQHDKRILKLEWEKENS